MTRESLRKSIEEHFGKIPDQRVVTRSSHKLVDIVLLFWYKRTNNSTGTTNMERLKPHG